jgi:hypothetical protein
MKKARPKSEHDPMALLSMLDNMFDEAQNAVPQEDVFDEESRAAAAALEAEFSFDKLMEEVVAETKKKEALAHGGFTEEDDGDRLLVAIPVEGIGVVVDVVVGWYLVARMCVVVIICYLLFAVWLFDCLLFAVCCLLLCCCLLLFDSL